MTENIKIERGEPGADPSCQPVASMRLCLDAAPASIAMLDRDMRYLAVNRHFLRDYKLGDRDLVGQCHYDVFPEIPARWREVHRRCLAGASERCDADPFVREDGNKTYVRWEMWPWRDAHGEIGGVMLFTEDVTERVTAENDRQQWSDVFHNAAFAIAVTDPQTNVVQYANRAFAEMLQMSADEVRGMNVRDFSPPEERARLPALLQEADRVGHVIFESRGRRKDGTEFPALVDITSVHRADGRHYRIATATDLTVRKLTDAALQKSETRYRTLLDLLHDGVIITQDERLVFYNRRMAEMLGADDGVLRDTSFEAFIHPDQLELVRNRFRNRIAGRQPPGQYETAFRHQVTGKPVHALLHARLVEHEGRPAVLGTVADISERRQIEEQLRQAVKLEAIGHLTGGLAHDFNNLLTVIIGNLDLALESLPPGAQSLVENALKGAQRGADLVQKLLSFARKQALKPQGLEIQRIVADMNELLRRTLGENIEIETKISADLWLARADRSYVESALVNLAINARDAMKEGGKLTIEVHNAHLDEAYAAANEDVSAGDYVMLAVSDTGTGIAPEILAQVVEPFFTTKEAGKGSGLGLSMIYGFIRQSGGHLKIDSKVGHGTTVRLYLPRADDAGVETPAPSTADNDLARGTERILVVEDDAMVRELVVTQLGGLGYQVVTAGSGPLALKRLAAGETFDLLFTDMVMPGGMTGHELADQARRHCPGLNVLFTSGYTDDAVVHRGNLNGTSDFLAKPYTRKDLAKKIRQALDRRRPI